MICGHWPSAAFPPRSLEWHCTLAPSILARLPRSFRNDDGGERDERDANQAAAGFRQRRGESRHRYPLSRSHDRDARAILGAGYSARGGRRPEAPHYRGPLPSALYDHWMRSFSDNAGATLHIRVIRGNDRHHVVEAAFKALGMALRRALEERDSVFSTKGAVL